MSKKDFESRVTTLTEKIIILLTEQLDVLEGKDKEGLNIVMMTSLIDSLFFVSNVSQAARGECKSLSKDKIIKLIKARCK